MLNTLIRIFYLTIIGFSSNAYSEYAFSAVEAMSLPPFCRGLSEPNFQSDAVQFKTNVSVPGQHTQHFCHGMKYILRLDYKTAIDEFRYVDDHSDNKNTMLTYNALYTGYAYENLGKNKEALKYYEKAINLNPKNTQAYSKLANYYTKLGQKKEAIETLKKGIQNAQKTKSLEKKLEKLESKSAPDTRQNEPNEESEINK